MKQICLTSSSNQGLIRGTSKHNMYPISTHCTVGPPPITSVTPTTTISENSPQSLPMQTPIFIIYAGQQPPPKSAAMQLNGKSQLHYTNGHVLNEATILQAANSAQALPMISSNGLSAPAQIILPPQTNGVVQQQKCEIPGGHFPTVINGQTIGQTVVQTQPTLVNINGTAALLHPSAHRDIVMPPRSLVNGQTSVHAATLPQVVNTTSKGFRTLTTPPIDPLKRARHVSKQTTPVCISHEMVSEKKNKIPPPLVQVKEEVTTEDSAITNGISQEHRISPMLSSSTITSPIQVSTPAPVLPLPHIPEASRSLSSSPTQNLVVKGSNNPTSLPYILLNEKQGEPFRKMVMSPHSISSRSTPHIYKTNTMPIFRFSTLNTLNNVQPLQILTAVPPHNSCVTLPDFMKQDATTIAH